MIGQSRANIAIIGGPDFERLFSDAVTPSMKIPYGSAFSPLIPKMAGERAHLIATKIAKNSRQTMPRAEQLLIDTVKALPLRNDKRFPNANALENTRFE